MTFGSLFAGIGGMDLGLERAGMTCRWQVEIDPDARRKLGERWPSVRRHDDVRTFPPVDGEWGVDLICGGFPCQDVSQQNPWVAGLEGARSGLWSEFHRLIRDMRPRYALIENVPALRFRGLDRVLCDLAEIGFDAEWESLPASAFGAPHGRDRIFIVAYPAGERLATDEVFTRSPFETDREKHANRIRKWPGRLESGHQMPGRVRWCPDPGICRVVDVVPGGLDRYRELGNAILPEVAEFIGRLILEHASR